MTLKAKYKLEFKIWQIYYDELSKQSIDKGFIPYNNIGVVSKAYENDVILDVWSNKRKEWLDVDYVGVLSWRFFEKTKLTASDVFREVSKANSPVISLSPIRMDANDHPYIRVNYKSILDLCKVIDDAKIFDFTLYQYPLKKNIWCNYWICSPEIFDLYCCNYLNKVMRFINTTKDKAALEVLNKTLKHRKGIEYSIVTFFLEGLFTVFLNEEKIKFTKIN
jgi:hypothetical protein